MKIKKKILQGRNNKKMSSSLKILQGLRVNSPWGEAKWAVDPWPLREKGLIVLVSPT